MKITSYIQPPLMILALANLYYNSGKKWSFLASALPAHLSAETRPFTIRAFSSLLFICCLSTYYYNGLINFYSLVIYNSLLSLTIWYQIVQVLLMQTLSSRLCVLGTCAHYYYFFLSISLLSRIHQKMFKVHLVFTQGMDFCVFCSWLYL